MSDIEHEERFREGIKIARLSIAGDILLATFKLFAGIVGRSQAMQADAVESLGDVVSQTVILISLKISRKPIDWDHPYGHGRIESIATGIISILIASAGVLILVRTIFSITTGHVVTPGAVALVAVVVVIVVKESLYQVVSRVARRHRSSLLMAGAKDHRKDAITSVATLVGIAGARLGFPIMDPLAAGLVSLFILKLAYDVAGTAGRELMDRVPEDKTMKEITGIASEAEGVAHAQTRARRLGSNLLVDVRIMVDPHLTVLEGHAIAKVVKTEIIANVVEVADVMVHVNPHLHKDEKE